MLIIVNQIKALGKNLLTNGFLKLYNKKRRLSEILIPIIQASFILPYFY